jgi:uncharacterized protein YcfL
MASKHRSACALLLTAALLIGGCGSSTSNSGSSTQQLIAKADAICKRVNARVAAANSKINNPQDFARIAPEIANYEQQALIQMRGLKAPSSLAQDWQLILSSAQKLAQNTATLSQYIKTNKLRSAPRLVTESKRLQQEMLLTAKRDGFKECSRAM